VFFLVGALLSTTVSAAFCDYHDYQVNVSSSFAQLSQGTGIQVQQGQTIQFQAFGTWCWGYPGSCPNADGTPGRPGSEEHPSLLDGPGFYFGQLIGRVVSQTTSSNYFLIGTSKTLIMPLSGQLFLVMNERVGLDFPNEWYFDNSGSIQVKIRAFGAGDHGAYRVASGFCPTYTLPFPSAQPRRLRDVTLNLNDSIVTSSGASITRMCDSDAVQWFNGTSWSYETGGVDLDDIWYVTRQQIRRRVIHCTWAQTVENLRGRIIRILMSCNDDDNNRNEDKNDNNNNHSHRDNNNTNNNGDGYLYFRVAP